MINPSIICNICMNRIHWHPAAGADCVNLLLQGPIGWEGSVAVEDNCPRMAEHTAVHICRRCEKALTAFFKDRKVAE
jgi:hypothetical protein